MFDFTAVITTVKNNPLLLTSFSFLAGGGLFATLRSIPNMICNGIQRQFIVSAEILDESAMFLRFKDWLSDNNYSKKNRLLSANLVYDDSVGHKLMLTPAPGLHVLFHKGHLLWIYREKDEAKGGAWSGKYIERFVISTFGRSQKFIRELLEDVVSAYESKYSGYTSLYVNAPSHWQFVHRMPERPLDSIILDKNDLAVIDDDLTTFKNNRQWYNSLGIPYHRGYLFYGVPGTGKSSLVSALAAKHKMDVHVLNLSDPKLDDSILYALALSVSDDCALLLEDVDALFKKRKESKEKTKNSVTFSALLNILDGVFAKEGNVVFMTTNHIELLDPALIRAGRIDKKLHFDYASRSQIKEMFMRFYPEATDQAEIFTEHIRRPLSMADLQSHFLTYQDDPAGAISNIHQLNIVSEIPKSEVPVS